MNYLRQQRTPYSYHRRRTVRSPQRPNLTQDLFSGLGGPLTRADAHLFPGPNVPDKEFGLPIGTLGATFNAPSSLVSISVPLNTFTERFPTSSAEFFNIMNKANFRRRRDSQQSELRKIPAANGPPDSDAMKVIVGPPTRCVARSALSIARTMP
jgi:hypothetical protein